MEPRADAKRYRSIQRLRAVAALLVVLHHARNPQPWLWNPVPRLEIGVCGVDIFFVISGFIMYSAARGESVGGFLRRRAVRIAPMYWIATAATLAYEAAFEGLRPSRLMLAHLLQSIALIPHYSFQHPGEIWPFLVPGWTLQYEAFFYLVFAAAIASRRLLPVLAGVLAGCVTAGLAVSSANPLWRTATNPLLLEFLGGVGIAVVLPRLRGRGWAGLAPLGALGMIAGALWGGPRVIGFGVPAVAIVAGVLAWEARSGREAKPDALTRLGDASYSIYLFQVLAIAAAAEIVRRLPLAGPAQFAAMLGVGAGLSVGLGWAAHVGLETPLLRRLSRRKPLNRMEALAAP